MQILPPELSSPASFPPLLAAVAVRVERGDLAALPVGELLQGVVLRATPQAATLQVAGRELVVQPGTGLQPGPIWLVRRPLEGGPPLVTLLPSATPQLPATMHSAGTVAPHSSELALPAPTPNTTAAPVGSAVPAEQKEPAARLVSLPRTPQLVETVEQLAPDRYRIRWAGQELTAHTTLPLAVGRLHLVQLEPHPGGVQLTAPATTPQAIPATATALLRQLPPADLAPALDALRQFLAQIFAEKSVQVPSLPATVSAEPSADGAADTIPTPLPQPVRHALVQLAEALQSFWPQQAQPPTAQQLQQLVEHGGLVHEARQAASFATTSSSGTPTQSAPAMAATPAPPNPPWPAAANRPPDLKGAILQLLDTLPAAMLPAVQAAVLPALQSITALQAANLLAQHQGLPYWLQVPFPDGAHWRTLYIALQAASPDAITDRPPPDGSARGNTTGRFHVLIHAPSEQLGQTWIDMSLAGQRLHAVLYFERDGTLQQAQAMEAELRALLQASDFAPVAVEFRSAQDLPKRHREQSAAMQAGRPASVPLVDWEV